MFGKSLDGFQHGPAQIMRESSEANPQPKKDSKWIHDWVCVKIGYPHAISVFFPGLSISIIFPDVRTARNNNLYFDGWNPPIYGKIGDG